MVPVVVKLPLTVDELFDIYPFVKVWRDDQEFAVVVPKPMEKLLPV